MYKSYNPYAIFNSRDILLFYASLKNVDFSSLSSDRIGEIDDLVNKWRHYFFYKTNGLLTLMSFSAEKLRVSNKWLGVFTDTERIYFYIMMVDPNLFFLEAYEAANTTDELRNLANDNFGILDKKLMKYEKALNDVIKIYDPNYVWALERIKKDG